LISLVDFLSFAFSLGDSLSFYAVSLDLEVFWGDGDLLVLRLLLITSAGYLRPLEILLPRVFIFLEIAFRSFWTNLMSLSSAPGVNPTMGLAALLLMPTEFTFEAGFDPLEIVSGVYAGGFDRF